ncbi:Protein phosphatase PP2A regulatory subunit [Hortaea werneckii]|nr:Protein phosphatase PP2A regulatory subunit [Hortaea werneckii]KAI6940723.1 Protein phosphatase PP2A regulatory subunit [Hortaea werneckii]KAI6945619.1 Protein phosphatase PP2A regulatory subunit [Hortaea werneckii]KAI6963657.1 Protein phosphatase PP2A regulatory subunit [Hortaea werneckii]KAI6969371.1 Protein phosphatase PP2A regulatory subunit [Hortaea werneckii]
MADPSQPTTLPTSGGGNLARSGLNTTTIVILAVVGALTAFGLAIALYCACGYGRLCSRRRRRGERRRSSFATDGRELHHFWNREIPLAEGGRVQHPQQQLKQKKRRGSSVGGELEREGAGTHGLPPVGMARVKVRPGRDVDALDFGHPEGPVVVEQADVSQQMPGFRERKEKMKSVEMLASGTLKLHSPSGAAAETFAEGSPVSGERSARAPHPQQTRQVRRIGKMVDASDGAPTPTWKFTQCFGDKGDVEDITEADIISTVEFDQTGNYLATGDKGGRVVLFERNETKKTCEYKFHTEFQSHEPEFDYLKSLEIEEKINKIKWCRRQNASHYLLSTNDKTIKLWKVFEKSLKVVAENNLSSELTPAGVGSANGGGPVRQPNRNFRNVADLKFPRMTHHDTVVAAVPRRVYANAHAYHINSISVNSDGETFISSDDLRINLWNLNIQDQSFNIVDIKPANMEELTEVITAAEFHPQSCNWFMYASSKGTIKMADMREKALCDEHAKQFEQEEDPSSRSFFSEIISSISDVRFSPDGRYILSRDYLTVKIWDVNMEKQPVKTIPIHEHLRPRLCDTYENDSIFDKFEVTFSGDARNVMTGSYNNNFMIYPSEPGNDTEVVLQADKSAFKAKKVGIPTPMNPGAQGAGNTVGGKKGSRANSPAPAGGAQRMRKETDADQIDFNKKILHMSWHPKEDSIAIAATNNLFVFSAL